MMQKRREWRPSLSGAPRRKRQLDQSLDPTTMIGELAPTFL
jgi:hypothetical protein